MSFAKTNSPDETGDAGDESTAGQRVRHWDTRYGETDRKALSWFQDHDETSLDLILRHGAAKASVIDVGAGNATLADDLLARGYDDLALFDLSEVALSQTRDRLAGKGATPRFIQGDITQWAPDRQWDVWHDRAVFHFLTEQAAQDAYLRALERATAPGALVVIATFSRIGPERCSGLPVQRYGTDDLVLRLGNGFELIEGFEKDHITPGGGVQNFTHAAFRRV